MAGCSSATAALAAALERGEKVFDNKTVLDCGNAVIDNVSHRRAMCLETIRLMTTVMVGLDLTHKMLGVLDISERGILCREAVDANFDLIRGQAEIGGKPPVDVVSIFEFSGRHNVSFRVVAERIVDA